MSIVARYRRLPLEEFDRLRADPTLAREYLHDQTEAAWELPRDANIGKTWHGLHVLLTGHPEYDNKGRVPPARWNVVQGGTPTDWEATYGMVRSLSVEEVGRVASALLATREAELRRRYDPEAFNAARIYPHGAEWDAEDLELLLGALTVVRNFFLQAALEGEVALLSLD